MVFRKAAVRRPRKNSDGKVEPRRTVLTLVVAVWREVLNLVLLMRSGQHEFHSAIDLGIALTTSLVRGFPTIPDAREHETVLDSVRQCFVQRKPRDGSDRPRD